MFFELNLNSLKGISHLGPNLQLPGTLKANIETLFAAGLVYGRIATIVPATYSGAAPEQQALELYDGSSSAAPCGVLYSTFKLISKPGEQPEVSEGSNLTSFTGVSNSFLLTNYPYPSSTSCFVESPSTPYSLGCPLYSGTAANGTLGLWTPDIPKANAIVCGRCEQIPTVEKPFLGVSFLI